MSKPSGAGSGGPGGPGGPGGDQFAVEPGGEDLAGSDPITETFAVPVERRFTAPGFDAGSTQIIDRVPDAPTEVFDVDTGQAGPRVVGPGPRLRHRRRRRVPVILTVAAAAAAVALGAAVLVRSGSPRVSQQDLVRSAIQTFDTAVQTGDLATLRSVTCGQTRDTYTSYDDSDWASTYARVAAAKQYPVVASIDDVVVNGDHAEANVTTYMAFDPATTSTRSFDLQFRDDQWKICQAS